jgi:hypothetical protein
MRSLIVSAVALFALGQVADARQLPAGVTEVRVSSNLEVEDSSAVLAQFPAGSEAPTFTVCWRFGLGVPPCDTGAWAGLESSQCTVYVVVHPRALPLKTSPDITDGIQSDDGGPEFFIDSVHADGEPVGFMGGALFVGRNGETLRIVETTNDEDQFGCWAGLALQYAKQDRDFYRR